MKKEINMLEVLGHGEDYYVEEYQKTWRSDLALLEKITSGCSKEEVQKLYYMIIYEFSEFAKMIKYIESNKQEEI